MASRGIVKTHVRIETLDKLTDVFNEMSKGACEYHRLGNSNQLEPFPLVLHKTRAYRRHEDMA